jgi:outer membrane protein OmpA-like peptidoglycan-associated protein
MNAETVDGWADEDGCPDPDNDGDGILDEQDLCPDEPEERNGVKDEDGCPDHMIAVRREGAIAILQPILFASGSSKIERDSMVIVQSVATLLQDNTDILQMRVEGHTDNKGKPDSNQRLSQRRAESVVKKLIELGVESTRLEAVGYGDARPVDSNRTEEGRANNRRIEFQILAQEAPRPEVRAAPENPWGFEAPKESPIGPAPVTAPEPAAPVELKPAENPW